MLRPLALTIPPSRPCADMRPAERVAYAFELARAAPLERDVARAMHAAANVLASGLDAYDWQPENYDDGT